MRTFVDLNLRPALHQEGQWSELISKAVNLGFKVVAFSLPVSVNNKIAVQIREECQVKGLDFVSRINLRPKSSPELLKQLRRHRRRFEILAVDCTKKAIARTAARDHRVDLLSFPSLDSRFRFFDQAEAKLALHSNSALEIEIAMLLSVSGSYRARFLHFLRKEVAIAQKFDVPIVLSSGATDPYMMRGPQDLACLGLLFGMLKESGLDAVSVTPCTLVERNRKKLRSDYVARGMRLVHQGEVT
jgi:ribonuclease P/MRP protein subunit RPP1